ncbi:hypothetical protein UFOVP1580_1, partial [uncultured Caudovirales phage]
MNTLDFTLIKDLVVPSKGDLQGAYFMFKKDEHGLTYRISPDARNKTLSITLQAYRIDTGASVCDLDRWTVT